ncbi:MAG: Uma2 family endonuclease [Geodermatophilaceae bacterium]|nr:Uma2 family endonuclease [Geodermatophilaceae bacterium]MDQ3454007.1 Uma2 family endonuclease [Actinomycetota bacterium]
MTAVSVMPRAEYDWTVDDLESLPDDGLQYELIDGILIVSPAPVPRHQRAVIGLIILLHAACPADLEVLVSPIDYQPNRRTSVQPDVLVVSRAEVGPKNLTERLLLAVEVLSPSTRRKDLVLKHSVYADAAVASYWTVDPAEPSITCWDLVDGRYVEAGRAIGDEELSLERPFSVNLSPGALAAG